ncbi:MAG: LysM peptidoglycan-binding domain-containing protein, partial [Planctomycetota bacterium]
TESETESAGPGSDRSDFGVIEVLPRRVVAGRADAGDGDEVEGEGEREVDAAESDAEGIRVEVRPGDTLTSIARRHLGDGGRWREIHLANRETIGSDPDALKVGMVLVLPADPPR